MHINTTLQHKIMEAFIYSPDGKYLVFISAKSAVDSGAHNATNSLHRIEWCTDGKLDGSLGVADVVWTPTPFAF
jgi:acylaminoacyl-peptidase